MVLTVKHDERYMKFYALVDGKECWLKYEFLNSHILDLKALFIPRQMRGYGLARKILESAIAFAKKRKMKIVASCSYVRRFCERHHDTKNLMYRKFNDFSPMLKNIN